MSSYKTKNITIEFLQNLVNDPPPTPALLRTVRSDRIVYAFDMIGQKTGWEHVQLSGFSNQSALAFRMLGKGDYIIIFTKEYYKCDDDDDDDEDYEINIVAVEKTNTNINLA
jgi:hypothetical protein